MIVEFIDTIPSTQEFLCDSVRKGVIKPPFMIVASEQSSGIGSRNNDWQGFRGNLFLSFCVDKNFLPNDLHEASISIYFSMIMREVLALKGSKIWIKWPNDFYIDDKKIGGTITSKISEIYICGIGLNLVAAPKNAGILDIQIGINELVWGFAELLEKKILWKQIFSKFRLDFQKSKKFITHIGGSEISLESAEICDDGAILVNEKRVYSLR
ncbi:biotin--[acetyl-CoA-carboxylase] ligase [Campylobacter sp.]|uniref:biotin--[acetyl-CoA-carboxylase] ligase n=1 Tax=Campylobacter sp. TaxID=205 RepID=UPI0026FAC2FA|nr:biotin--[acetyl-CoA-carboxylase] ligase [Campylobacter sp.]